PRRRRARAPPLRRGRDAEPERVRAGLNRAAAQPRARAARGRAARNAGARRRRGRALARADGGVRAPRRSRTLGLLRTGGSNRARRLPTGARGLPGALAGAAAVIRLRPFLVAALALVALPAAARATRPEIRLSGENLVRIWPIRYRAHDGLGRRAYVVLPRWY